MRHQLWVFTGEVLIVEDLAFSTGDEPGLAFYAGDESVAVARNGEAWERPELSWLGVGGDLGRTLEADDRWNIKQ